MFKELKNNNQGIIFVTVLAIIIVAMVLAVSVLSLNISQVTSSENEVKQIQAQILTDGGLARALMNQFSASASNLISYTETIGNTTFTITTNITTNPGPVGSETTGLDIDVVF